ncbi:conserved hypothetical protein [Leptospira interrogans serovar Manilae]|uniref:Tocopherol cyclase n=1 Tax=Leptospira interrogans serovar Manilae TaxID=214675 RepID=A0AAQ1SQT4_LEPIR|nr:hypothetical protein LIMLP_13235 [Leptospira interrogans serovar Manilae]AKP30581.1 hypothetical protein LIMHP_13235 [Leptospira interrogans serovar Manilae]EYU62147.1 hypothetical protein CI00_01065 [Leptospira interrogans serovar Manilae]SOR63745.1 conserved hypothetical protein [Leptospira interrogans serovar Manilae]
MNVILSNFNHPRFKENDSKGHYESWFVRANHPNTCKAVWIRYTIFSPKNFPEKAMGELWAIYFDGEKNTRFVSKSEFPIDKCKFNTTPLSIMIGDSELSDSHLKGSAGNKKDSEDFFWDLNISNGSPPLFLFPENLYQGSFPKAKVLVGNPLVKLNGSLKLGSQNIQISDWLGSHNHNWGSKHTDQYTWGQVVGFEEETDSFLELATAKLKIGLLWTPAITPIVFRFRGKDYKLNHPFKSFGRAQYRYFDWNFSASSKEIQLKGRIFAEPNDFACLQYWNPPGGWKYCLNSKIASTELFVKRKEDLTFLKLTSSRKTAFEILTDDLSHGMKPEV